VRFEHASLDCAAAGDDVDIDIDIGSDTTGDSAALDLRPNSPTA
jgi:hypothetical protein